MSAKLTALTRKPGSLKEKIETIAAVHSYLEEQKEIGKVMSLDSTIKVAEKVKGEPLEPFEMNIANQRLPAQVKSQIIDPYVSFSETKQGLQQGSSIHSKG